MKTKIIFSFFIALSSLSFANAHATPEKVKFWKSFRQIFLDEDFKKLATFAVFPVEVRGSEDSAPRFALDKAHFKKCFAMIYARDVGIAKFEKSHRDYIFELKNLPESEGESGGSKDQLRVGDLVFERKPENKHEKKFKLVRFYLDTEEDNVKTSCQ